MVPQRHCFENEYRSIKRVNTKAREKIQKEEKGPENLLLLQSDILRIISVTA